MLASAFQTFTCSVLIQLFGVGCEQILDPNHSNSKTGKIKNCHVSYVVAYTITIMSRYQMFCTAIVSLYIFKANLSTL